MLLAILDQQQFLALLSTIQLQVDDEVEVVDDEVDDEVAHQA
jgi:hypothetical protein